MLDDQGLTEASMMPSSFILVISSSASLIFAMGILLVLRLIGRVFPVSIACLTSVVRPKSEEFFENYC